MKTQSHNHFRRLLSITAASTLVAFVAIGGFLIHAATQKRAFSGKISVKVCKKLPNGQWAEIDKGEGAVSFEGNLIEAASGKQFTSNNVWNGRSAKGKSFSSTPQGAVKLTSDLTSGRFDLTSVPIRLALNGKQHAVEFSLTTESISAPNGESLSGKRVKVVNKQGDIAVVGFSKPVRVPVESATANALAGQKQDFEELIFIARAEGKIAAK
jgi:hypothetical protein